MFCAFAVYHFCFGGGWWSSPGGFGQNISLLLSFLETWEAVRGKCFLKRHCRHNSSKGHKTGIVQRREEEARRKKGGEENMEKAPPSGEEERRRASLTPHALLVLCTLHTLHTHLPLPTKQSFCLSNIFIFLPAIYSPYDVLLQTLASFCTSPFLFLSNLFLFDGLWISDWDPIAMGMTPTPLPITTGSPHTTLPACLPHTHTPCPLTCPVCHSTTWHGICRHTRKHLPAGWISSVVSLPGLVLGRGTETGGLPTAWLAATTCTTTTGDILPWRQTARQNCNLPTSFP